MTELTPVAQILYLARAHLREPQNWTQNFWGTTAEGYPLSLDDISDASCFCLDGALHRAANTLKLQPFLPDAEKALLKHLGADDLSLLWDWNDAPSRKFEEVTALLEAVILTERT